MLQAFHGLASLVWVLLAVVSLVLVWRASFEGKTWLLTFISINIIAFVISFLLPMLFSSIEASSQALRIYYTNVSPIIYIGSLAFLLLFLLNLQSSKSLASSSIRSNANDPYRLESEGTSSTSVSSSLRPPIWLLVLTGISSIVCLIHNANGSILRSIALAIAKPTSGYGAANDYASQLNVMGTLANVVGTLYIITALLWLSCIAIVIYKFFKNKHASA